MAATSESEVISEYLLRGHVQLPHLLFYLEEHVETNNYHCYDRKHNVASSRIIKLRHVQANEQEIGCKVKKFHD